MISVGRRDGRSELGLGFGVGEGMEETELEEGEARFQNNVDPAIDPDVDFSYLDVKVQNVLGHFQKDFEGGVSAENLGAKFGGYGSFLPTYQRSPTWTHTRTPPKSLNCNTSMSPNNLHAEADHQNSVISSSASQSARHGLKVSAVNDVVKQEVRKPPSRGSDDFISGGELCNKSTTSSDPKTIKVRIKMGGSDHLSTRRNAEIYNGLGLDVSPSSSFDESPASSEGFPHDSPDESPATILRMMTSFPVPGGALLSPLPLDLLCLTEKESMWNDAESKQLNKGNKESSSTFPIVHDASRAGRKAYMEKKPKPSEKNSAARVKKETVVDPLACEELVSNTLRLPLLSDSNCNVDDAVNRTSKSDDIIMMDESLPYIAKQEPLDEKRGEKEVSLGAVWEEKKASSGDNSSITKGDSLHEEKTDLSGKFDPSFSRGGNSRNAEPSYPSKDSTSQKSASLEKGRGKSTSGKEISPSSVGKKKSKVSQSNGSARDAGGSKHGLKSDSSSVTKTRKSPYENGCMSKTEEEEFKIDYGKGNERYREFFGDFEIDNEDSDIALEEKKSVGILDKCTIECSSATKEKLIGKKNHKQSTSMYGRTGSNMACLNGNGTHTDAAPIVTTVVQEDWVCCDKCHKWRLLPLGSNPDNLPDKWLCSMLYWLPGMNRCSVSQEETTVALRSLYHVPADGGQNSQQAQPGGIATAVYSADVAHCDQSYKSVVSGVMTSDAKKRIESKDVVNETKHDGSIQSSNSRKKNIQKSTKSLGANGVNHPPKTYLSEFQDSGFSGSLVMEMQIKKQREKNKMREKSSGGGDIQRSTGKNKRDSYQNCSRASKKTKTDNVHSTDEDWASDRSGFSINMSEKDRSHFKDLPKESHHDSKSSVRDPVKQIHLNSSDGSVDRGKVDDRDVSKKRKLDNCQVETSENDRRKEKKGKEMLVNSGREEISANKSTDRPDNYRGRSYLKNEQIRSLDAINSSKREVVSTSSSSKVSGSQKTKATFQERKGSPVESVSSSPIRILNQEKSGSDRGISDSQDIGLVNSGSPKHKLEPSPELATCLVTNGDGSSRRSGKGSSSRSKDKIQSSRSELEKDNLKIPKHLNENVNNAMNDEKLKAGKTKLPGNSVLLNKMEKSVSKKESSGKQLNESVKKDSRSKHGYVDGSDVRKDTISDPKQKLPVDNDSERTSKWVVPSGKKDQGKSHVLPPSGKGQNGGSVLSVDAVKDNDPLKAPKQNHKVAENQNGNHPSNTRHSTPNWLRVRDHDSASPLQKDSSSQAATNALKEAKDLKHLADRLKNSVSNNESTGLYFQAALKFLHGAALLESCSSESSKHSEMSQSMTMYSSTAKLCEFCAHEYEKSKDMAAAALAYKCTEVAYLKVVYSSHSSANRDRHELQTALQMVPTGESPSSSASDLDNINNPVTGDNKTALAKGVSPPRVVGNHAIAARNRPSLVRLLSFAQDVNFAMDASRKSRLAFAASNLKLEEGISSVKKALDFNFQDVEGLLHLVRLAMESLSR